MEGYRTANAGYEKRKDLKEQSPRYQEAYNASHDAVWLPLTPDQREAKRGAHDGGVSANQGYEKRKDLEELSPAYQGPYNASHDAVWLSLTPDQREAKRGAHEGNTEANAGRKERLDLKNKSPSYQEAYNAARYKVKLKQKQLQEAEALAPNRLFSSTCTSNPIQSIPPTSDVVDPLNFKK